jgi:hypothetical protein
VKAAATALGDQDTLKYTFAPHLLTISEKNASCAGVQDDGVILSGKRTQDD